MKRVRYHEVNRCSVQRGIREQTVCGSCSWRGVAKHLSPPLPLPLSLHLFLSFRLSLLQSGGMMDARHPCPDGAGHCRSIKVKGLLELPSSQWCLSMGPQGGLSSAPMALPTSPSWLLAAGQSWVVQCVCVYVCVCMCVFDHVCTCLSL